MNTRLGGSQLKTLSAILKEDPPGISGTDQHISPALERVVRRCLEKAPEQRFQSARDLGYVAIMDRVQRIQELYHELHEMHEKMRPFAEPQAVGYDHEWTQEEADYHLQLHQRQEEILKELADLEGGHI